MLSLLLVLPARAQEKQYFDVPFVPTPHVVIEEMLRLAGVTDKDVVMDLGSGDGRLPITAALLYGARGLGVDLDPELVEQSRAWAEAAGLADRVRFQQQDLFKADLSEATVITLYLLPGIMGRLQQTLYNLKPGTRLVSHDFRLGDWQPDAVTQIRKNTFLWVVPAKVAGQWRFESTLPGKPEMELELRQKFQEVDGYGKFSSRHAQMWEVKLRGDRITFAMVDDRDRENEAAMYFEGRVNGDVIEGQVRRGTGKSQTLHTWRAVRIAAAKP
ncbi:MAG: class I SAM-dependent methyltransferase [Burkholderiales bacterium]|nr:class I SAM-dependent methyltransferase [Burkholderiales bacterium]